MTWTNDFNVDVTLLDQQHKKLFALIERLRLNLIGQVRNRGIAEIVVALGQYTEAHFLSEERLMIQSGYPDYENHKRAHDSMIDRVQRYQLEMNDGRSTVAEELHAFLNSWWSSHILVTDKSYCRHLVSKGIC